METFKTIEGYDNYEVSDFGNVRNKKTGRVLKPRLDRAGYPLIDIGQRSVCRSTMNVHKLVANAFLENPDNKPNIDHIDNCRTNNNINNLRYCTQSQNLMNASIRSDNTSGIRGVSYDKVNEKWYAEIWINGKKKYIGRYLTLEEAATARRLKAKELFKEFMHRSEELLEELI